MPSKTGSRTSPRGDRRKRVRRAQPRSELTRERIEEAALKAFAEIGFDAASTREIAARAGVKQQLITYHYETKLGLWKAVADRSFARLRETLVERARGLEGVGEPDRARLLMRAYLRFSAEHPEFARFMMNEGARPGPRLTWLVERHLRPMFEAMRPGIEKVQARGFAPAGDPIHIAYVLVGATVIFSQAAEFELITGRDPRSPEVVEAHADLVERMLLSGAAGERVDDTSQGDRHE